jgi:hypothetical protein
VSGERAPILEWIAHWRACRASACARPAHAKARHGAFRVAADGKAILGGLRDAQLPPLGAAAR